MDDKLFRKLKRWFSKDIEKANKFRAQAEEDYAFYNGDQWDATDLAILRQNNRPVMTFNRIAPLVNAVTGSERNNKREVQFIPRTLGAAIPNELLTSAAEWFRDQTDAETEDSDAFTDAVICGMGWTDTRLDYENDPAGIPVISRLDPFKMAWDCNAVKPNLIDAQRLWYIDRKPLEYVKQMFPDVDESKLHAAWAHSAARTVHVDDPLNYYGENAAELTANEDFTGDREVTIVECRYFEHEPYYKTNRGDLTQKQYDMLKQVDPALEGVRLTRKVAKRVFIGSEILGEPDNPLVPIGQLGWECITAYYDKGQGIFYGVVRPAKDPQRWANKFFSQVMHILNSQAKGGILAERGAFDDDRQAEESLAKADTITWLKHGAVGQQAIMPKPSAVFPAGFFQLFNESKEAISQVTGLSPEFIGTREVNQAGILEAQRRQSSLNLLAGIFDSLKKYRKRQGKIILYLIQNYLSDGRLVKIVGEDRAQYVPLTRENIVNVEYDIIVDDSPTSPNEKERTFSVLKELMPQLQAILPPQAATFVLDYVPLPATLVGRFKTIIEQNEQQQQQMQMQQMQMQMMQQQQGGQGGEQQQSPQENIELIKQQTIREKSMMDLKAKLAELSLKEREVMLKEWAASMEAEERQRQQAIEQVQNAIRQQSVNTMRGRI